MKTQSTLSKIVLLVLALAGVGLVLLGREIADSLLSTILTVVGGVMFVGIMAYLRAKKRASY
jgi:hypothetical protein